MTTENKKPLIPLKYLGLMCLLFLIEHLYLSGVYARLVDMCYGHQKTCVTMRLDYVLRMLDNHSS